MPSVWLSYNLFPCSSDGDHAFLPDILILQRFTYFIFINNSTVFARAACCTEPITALLATLLQNMLISYNSSKEYDPVKSHKHPFLLEVV